MENNNVTYIPHIQHIQQAMSTSFSLPSSTVHRQATKTNIQRYIHKYREPVRDIENSVFTLRLAL